MAQLYKMGKRMSIDIHKYDTNEDKLLEIKNKIEIFNTLTDDELLGIVYDIEFKKYNKGMVVIEKDEISDDIYFILSGECIIHQGNTSFILEAGSVVGEIASMFDLPRKHTVLIHADNTALLKFKIDKKDSKKHSYAFSKLFYELSKQLNEKLNVTMERLNEL